MRSTSWDGPIGDPSGGVRPFGRIYQDPITAAIVVGGSAISGMMASDAQSEAASTAAGAQTAASQAEMAERRRQFDAIRELLQPYVNAGPGALNAQQDLLGLNGADAQGTAVSGIERGPLFGGLLRQGENAILQNASATGGLRGGNVQGALGQFRPQLLAQLIDQQYNRLGGLTSIGQNAAAGVGNAGMQTANGIGGALQGIGAAQAGAALASGAGQAGMWNGIGSSIGTAAMMRRAPMSNIPAPTTGDWSWTGSPEYF